MLSVYTMAAMTVAHNYASTLPGPHCKAALTLSHSSRAYPVLGVCSMAACPTRASGLTNIQLLMLPRGSGISGYCSSCRHSPSTMNLYWWYLDTPK